MTTFLQATNAVLSRLRENSVSTVSASAYSSMIGKFINDAKRAVEDAWNWDALQSSFTVTTTPGTSLYVVTGIGRRFKDVTVNDTTNRSPLSNVPAQWITNQQELSNVQQGAPTYYAWNGTDGTDSKIEFYATPDGTYTIKISACVPQVDLVNDSDVITVQSEAIIQGAYARAIAERGEDGGMQSGEAMALYKNILSDQIALEATRQCENDHWCAV
jgi:hypothetical protein